LDLFRQNSRRRGRQRRVIDDGIRQWKKKETRITRPHHHVDMDARTLSIEVHGVDHGVAFTELPPSVYPIVRNGTSGP